MTKTGDVIRSLDGYVRVISVTPISSPQRIESLDEMRARLKKGLPQPSVNYTQIKYVPA